MKLWESYSYIDVDLDKKSNKEKNKKTSIEQIRKTSIELKDDDLENISIDGIIKILIEKNKKWENVYCHICGKKLYSCDIKTVDDAYLILFWKTKTEKEKKEREEMEEMEKIQRKNLELIGNIPKWIKEWKKYIERNKRNERESHVNYCARNLYCWNNMDVELKILKMLYENESMNKIQDEFNKHWYVWITRSIIKTYITYFSKRWFEFNQTVR